MLLLLHDDPTQSICSPLIDGVECLNLFMHMPQHNSLDRHRGCSDGLSAGEPRQNSQKEPARRA